MGKGKGCAASGGTVVIAEDPAALLTAALAEHLAEEVGIPDDGTAQDYAERLRARGYDDATSFDDIPLDELAAEPLNFAPSNLHMVERHRERAQETRVTAGVEVRAAVPADVPQPAAEPSRPALPPEAAHPRAPP